MTVVKSQNPKVGIVIINYNGEKYVEHCLEQLLLLEYKNVEIVFLDNDSTDKSVEIVKSKFANVEVHQTGANLGYSGGAEVAVNMSFERKWEFLLIMNPDIIFMPDYLTLIVEKMKKDHRIGAIIGKLSQYMFFDREKTEVIDSTGIVMYSDRRCVDRGQAEKDEGQYDKEEQVFGITGAAPLYRVEALEDIKINGFVFDEDFFMYKEDIDISWRLNLFGWQNWYLPKALAYHGRGTGIEDRQTYIKTAKKRKKLSKFQKHHSYRNQHFIQLKNELFPNVLHDFAPIVFKEILLTGFMVLREPFLFKSLYEVIKKTPKMIRNRREIMKRKRFDASQMRRIIELGR